MSAAIQFQGVVKRYGGVAVLDGLDLDVPAGSAFALVGANGAGKTTCIKSLLDFGRIDAGAVRIFGTDHRDHRARARLVYLPERFLPPHHLSGLEFLAYAARLHGVGFDAAAARAAVQSLDLDPDVLARPARSYSKGMAQKLGLASCLLSGKDLLILDEPSSGLDPKARLLVKRLLSALHAQGRTLFYSTHVLADVHAVCDRLAVLHRGRVLFTGTPEQCLARYGGATLEEAYLNCVDAGPAHAGPAHAGPAHAGTTTGHGLS